jgi:hypothetical protein
VNKVALVFFVFLLVPLLFKEKVALLFFADREMSEHYCVKAVLTEVSELQKTHFPVEKKYAQNFDGLSYDIPPKCKTHWKYLFQPSQESIGYTLTAENIQTSEKFSINEKEKIFPGDRTSPQMPQ